MAQNGGGGPPPPRHHLRHHQSAALARTYVHEGSGTGTGNNNSSSSPTSVGSFNGAPSPTILLPFFSSLSSSSSSSSSTTATAATMASPRHHQQQQQQFHQETTNNGRDRDFISLSQPRPGIARVRNEYIETPLRPPAQQQQLQPLLLRHQQQQQQHQPPQSLSSLSSSSLTSMSSSNNALLVSKGSGMGGGGGGGGGTPTLLSKGSPLAAVHRAYHPNSASPIRELIQLPQSRTSSPLGSNTPTSTPVVRHFVGPAPLTLSPGQRQQQQQQQQQQSHHHQPVLGSIVVSSPLHDVSTTIKRKGESNASIDTNTLKGHGHVEGGDPRTLLPVSKTTSSSKRMSTCAVADSSQQQQQQQQQQQHQQQQHHLPVDRHDGSSIICRECKRCKCAACGSPRPLPATWICRDKYQCSAETVVDQCSCMCCVKALFYHTTKDYEMDDDVSCADRPCSCQPHQRCTRWACIGLLTALMPCLLCYWPLRGCLRLCELCYTKYNNRHACQCPTSSARKSMSSSSSVVALVGRDGVDQSRRRKLVGDFSSMSLSSPPPPPNQLLPLTTSSFTCSSLTPTTTTTSTPGKNVAVITVAPSSKRLLLHDHEHREHHLIHH